MILVTKNGLLKNDVWKPIEPFLKNLESKNDYQYQKGWVIVNFWQKITLFWWKIRWKILFENAHILVNHWKSNQFQQCKKWMKKSQKNQCFSFISKYFLKNEISLKYGVFQTFYKNNMWKSAVLCRIWLVMFAKTSGVWWKRKKQAFFSDF